MTLLGIKSYSMFCKKNDWSIFQNVKYEGIRNDSKEESSFPGSYTEKRISIMQTE